MNYSSRKLPRPSPKHKIR